ncbi:MAG: hypothetical protein AAFW89_10705, partial [Bacteroidota bacterium]
MIKPRTKILNPQDKVVFEKALKFYFFARQQDVKHLEDDIRDRFNYAANIAYSLIITGIRDNQFRIEYMDFLNEEHQRFCSLGSSALSDLMIPPDQIDEIEFPDRMRYTFEDDFRACLLITKCILCLLIFILKG